MDRKIRWGILSTARIGAEQVIPAIQQSRNSEVAAVGSRSLERAQTFAAQHKIPKAYGSYEELLADPEIDAIYNPLPNDQHGPWSLRCAEAGKPVLCEKPLASNADEARHMEDVFAKRGLLLSEAFMYRYHPQTQKVKAMVEAGAVGQIHFMQATFNFSIGREDDIRLNNAMAGGALMDVGCYCVNVIRYMLGEEPDQVRALADFGKQSQVDERLVGLLSFPSGALAHLDCSLRTHFTQTYEIRGTEGRILVEKAYVPFRPDPDAEIVIRYWHSVPRVEVAQFEEIKVERVNQYTLMVEDFAGALLKGHSPRFSIQDAINNMQVIDRLLTAARSKS